MIKTFVFNPIQVNCFVLYDTNKECAIVDTGAQSAQERQELTDFISQNNLVVKHILLTHAHIDHICGAPYITKHFSLPLELGGGADKILRLLNAQASCFGFEETDFDTMPTKEIKESDTICFGSSELKVISTPGHCAGSVSFFNEKENYVLTGDALFAGGIGRTDLPTGDYNTLVYSITHNLFSLPSKTVCLTGHGSQTTIGVEKEGFIY